MNQNALKLLEQRYFDGPTDSWQNLVNRLVNRVFVNDEFPITKQNVIDEIVDLVWLPNSPALANCGKKRFGAFACFVVGPSQDSLEAHLEALTDIAVICRAGGGAGFTGSHIRPAGSPVAGSTHGYAYGPNKFARAVSDWADMMTQSGFRKMALMYTLNSEHPDIETFIDIKKIKEGDLYNFNQSIFASDLFMNRATNGTGHEHQLLKKIAYNAWFDGEPGLLFGDTINRLTPYRYSNQLISATNPCGEQPLPPYGSCNLASINLNHEIFWSGGRFNFNRLEQVVENMVVFMDNLGSVNHFPNSKFQNWYEQNRPIGIGVMGFADALLRLKVLYGSQFSLTFLEEVMQTIQTASYKKSEALAILKGTPKACEDLKRRNVTTVSIAPTGSIAFIAGCSHGIEPIFSPIYTRTDERGEVYNVEHELAHEPYFSATIDSINVPTWKQHIDVQLAAQKYVDSGISKTINFEENATPNDIFEAFVYAWKNGAKGLTVYRNNSRQKQVLNSQPKTVEQKVDEDVLCDNCKTVMVPGEGCYNCPSCGSSFCSV
jgi:ribonucleoside-diphosphate reductase alpha chain